MRKNELCGSLGCCLRWIMVALLQVSCDFCRETYTFGEQEVLDALPAQPQQMSS